MYHTLQKIPSHDVHKNLPSTYNTESLIVQKSRRYKRNNSVAANE